MTRTTSKLSRFAKKIKQLVRGRSQSMSVELSAPPARSELQVVQPKTKKLPPMREEDEYEAQIREKHLVTLDEEMRFITDCLRTLRVSKENSHQVAEVLVAADYRGQPSHGLHMLSTIVTNLKNKSIHSTAKPVILKQSLATAWVVGKNGLGPVVGNYCMDLAIEKARQVGVGFVSVKGSNNFGIASWYAMRAANENLIGIAMSNDSPLMAAYNGIDPVLGANPLACALPGTANSFVLDMSTTAVPMEKFEYALLQEKEISPDWVLDENGRPTCSPERAFTLAPFGAYKGYGLAGMVDILCGVLSGAHYSTKVRSWNPDDIREPANLGQAFFAIDPDVFRSGFEARANDFAQMLRLTKPIDALRPVRLPGDNECEHMRLVDVAGGVHFEENQLMTFHNLAEKLGVKPIVFK